jgi:hypothetical protein
LIPAVDYFDVACAIDFARENGVRVVNMSFGGGDPEVTPET